MGKKRMPVRWDGSSSTFQSQKKCSPFAWRMVRSQTVGKKRSLRSLFMSRCLESGLSSHEPQLRQYLSWPQPCSVRAGHCDVTNWTQFVWSRVLFPGHIHHLSLTQSIHNITHCYPTQLLATYMCLFVRIEFNSINRLALCVHSLSSSYKKNNSQPSTVRKFNRVWVILLLLFHSVRDNTVAMLVSLADNPILFSASINTDYRCLIPRLSLTSSLQTDNLILHVHT